MYTRSGGSAILANGDQFNILHRGKTKLEVQSRITDYTFQHSDVCFMSINDIKSRMNQRGPRNPHDGVGYRSLCLVKK